MHLPIPAPQLLLATAAAPLTSTAQNTTTIIPQDTPQSPLALECVYSEVLPIHETSNELFKDDPTPDLVAIRGT